MVPSKLTSKIGNGKKIAKKETKKIKKIINEEVRLGLHDSSSETDDVDLTKEMFPLRNYVNDRKEMINQMFSVIYGSKLKKMLPPILKDMPVEELKAECLIHLLGMSSKRILSVLDGKELDSSSESDTRSEKSASHESLPLTNNTKVKKGIIKQEGCSDISDDTADVDRDLDMLEIGINRKEMGDIMGDSDYQSKVKMKVLCVVFALFSVGCLAIPTAPTYRIDSSFDIVTADKLRWYLNAYSASGHGIFPLYPTCGVFDINFGGCYDTIGFEYYVEQVLIMVGQLEETVCGSYILTWQSSPKRITTLYVEVLYYSETLLIVVLHSNYCGCGSDYYESVLVLTSVQDFRMTPYYLSKIKKTVALVGLSYSQFTIVSQSCCNY